MPHNTGPTWSPEINETFRLRMKQELSFLHREELTLVLATPNGKFKVGNEASIRRTTEAMRRALVHLYPDSRLEDREAWLMGALKAHPLLS